MSKASKNKQMGASPAVINEPEQLSGTEKPEKPSGTKAVKPKAKVKTKPKAKPKAPAKRPVGAPTKYHAEYCEAIIEFFAEREKHCVDVEVIEKFYPNGTIKQRDRRVIPCSFPTFERFAVNIGICRDTLYEWEKTYPEFAEAMKKAKTIQRAVWLENSTAGFYPANFAKYVGAVCFGEKEKIEVTTKKGSLDEMSEEEVNEALEKLGYKKDGA